LLRAHYANVFPRGSMDYWYASPEEQAAMYMADELERAVARKQMFDFSGKIRESFMMGERKSLNFMEEYVSGGFGERQRGL